MGQLFAYAICVAVIAAVLLPALRAPQRPDNGSGDTADDTHTVPAIARKSDSRHIG